MVKFEVGELAVYQTKNQFLLVKIQSIIKKPKPQDIQRYRVWYNHKYKTTIVPYLNLYKIDNKNEYLILNRNAEDSQVKQNPIKEVSKKITRIILNMLNIVSTTLKDKKTEDTITKMINEILNEYEEDQDGKRT